MRREYLLSILHPHNPNPHSTFCKHILNIHRIPRQVVQPPLHILLHCTLNSTSVHVLHRLRLQHALVPWTAAPVEHTAVVHHALQAIAFPAEYVVGVCAVALAVRIRPHEGLGTVGGPQIRKRSSIPQRLVRELRHLDGMRGGAGAGGAETAACGGEHVGLVVWRVEVLAVPAGGEVVDCYIKSVTVLMGREREGGVPMMPAGHGLVGKSGVS
jgi:hypothetical protein